MEMCVDRFMEVAALEASVFPPGARRPSRINVVRSREMKIFVPFQEELMDRLGASPDDLVPFDLGYEVLHMEDPITGETLPLPELPEPA